MEKPADFHVVVQLLEVLGKEHEMVVMAPNNIPFLVLREHNVGKERIGSPVGLKLGLQTVCVGQPVLLWEADVVKEGPEHVVAVTVVILIQRVLIQKDWNATLHRHTRMCMLLLKPSGGWQQQDRASVVGKASDSLR